MSKVCKHCAQKIKDTGKKINVFIAQSDSKEDVNDNKDLSFNLGLRDRESSSCIETSGSKFTTSKEGMYSMSLQGFVIPHNSSPTVDLEFHIDGLTSDLRKFSITRVPSGYVNVSTILPLKPGNHVSVRIGTPSEIRDVRFQMILVA